MNPLLPIPVSQADTSFANATFSVIDKDMNGSGSNFKEAFESKSDELRQKVETSGNADKAERPAKKQNNKTHAADNASKNHRDSNEGKKCCIHTREASSEKLESESTKETDSGKSPTFSSNESVAIDAPDEEYLGNESLVEEIEVILGELDLLVSNSEVAQGEKLPLQDLVEKLEQLVYVVFGDEASPKTGNPRESFQWLAHVEVPESLVDKLTAYLREARIADELNVAMDSETLTKFKNLVRAFENLKGQGLNGRSQEGGTDFDFRLREAVKIAMAASSQGQQGDHEKHGGEALQFKAQESLDQREINPAQSRYESKTAVNKMQGIMMQQAQPSLRIMPENEKIAEKLLTLEARDAGVDTKVFDGRGALIPQTTNSSPATARIQIPAAVSFMRPEWGNWVAQRTAMMAANNIKFAEIHLDPPELGPLQVKVAVHNDQAAVSFVAHSAQVREALDQHATRLREMLQEQGMDLVDVDVSDHASEQEDAEHPQATNMVSSSNLDEETNGESTVHEITVMYGVDHYV